MASQRCLYEILGVERTSTSEEIRAAYRKLALKLHPDKLKWTEREQVEEATARFQEVVRAYEVLSDPKERSWYDSHRSQILFSSSNSSSSSPKYSDSDIDLWPFFRPCAFSGFGDRGKGFYKVYGDLFDKIFKEEVAYAHAMGEEVQEAPLMGNLESPYAQVSAFYNYWVAFSTVKDFSWVDEYRTGAAPNRKVRRLMQEENQKLRKLARREFNDSVRALAQFVKKRDKRVLDKLVEKKKELQLKAAQATLRRKQLEEERRHKAMQFEEQEWAKAAADDYDDNWYDGNDTKGADPNQEFYCILCSKKFKSDKQWKNHEQSKKHKERVVELRNSFAGEDGSGLESDSLEQLEDDGELDIGSLSVDGHETEKEEPADDFENLQVQSSHSEESVEDRGENIFASNNTEEEHIGNNNSSKEKTTCPSIVDDKIVSNADISSYGEDHESGSNQTDDEDSVLKEMLKTHITKKSATNVYDTDNDDINSIYYRNAEHPNSRKSTRFEPKNSYFSKRDTNDGSRSDIGRSSSPAQKQGSRKIAEEKRKLMSSTVKQSTEDIVEDNRAIQQREVDCDSIAERQEDMLEVDKEGSLKTSAKQSIDNKSTMPTTSARNARSKDNKKSKGKKGKSVAKLEGHTCGTCGEDFGSRNQLFSHLQVTNHAILKAR